MVACNRSLYKLQAQQCVRISVLTVSEKQGKTPVKPGLDNYSLAGKMLCTISIFKYGDRE